MATAVTVQTLQPGYRLQNGGELNRLFGKPIVNAQDSITATAGGLKSNAFALSAVINRVSIAVSAGDSVLLPSAQTGSNCFIVNDSANPIQVFGAGTDTINDIATATGYSQAPGTTLEYVCPVVGKYYINGIVGTGVIGTFTINGATPVVVSNTNITANSSITWGLKTLGGTAAPVFESAAQVAGTSFTVNSTAGNTSVYNYVIFN